MFKRKLAVHAVAAGAHKTQPKQRHWPKPKPKVWPLSRAEREAEAMREMAGMEFWRNLSGR